MSEVTLDAIARRVQVVEEEVAVLRKQYTGDKRAVEERLDRIEKTMALDAEAHAPQPPQGDRQPAAR